MTEGDQPDPDPDLREAVDRFLDGAAAVYGEYEQGYMDADSALTVLERHVENLRAVAADADDGGDAAAEADEGSGTTGG